MDLVALARTHTKTAIETLVAICKDPAISPGSRVTAACALLDRGYGRPFQAVAIAHGGTGELAQLLAEIDGTSRGLPDRTIEGTLLPDGSQ